MGTATAPVDMIRLRHPEWAGLEYGADRNDAIKFGPQGGMPAFEALVPADHPLLDAMLRDHPEIEVVLPGPAKVYLCPLHPDREFSSKPALRSHMRSAGHTAADLLEVLGGAVDPTSAATDVAPGLHISQDGVVMQDAQVPPAKPVKPGFGG